MKTSKQNIQVGIAVVASIAVIGLLFWGGFGLLKNNNNETDNNTNIMQISNDNLKVEDTIVGTGKEAVPGKIVVVNYTGRFTDGKVFDSSIGRQPFQFVLGQGMVIKGWDQGVVGMKVGGKRHLVIAPDLAYGSKDYGPIPGNSTLVFDVELLNVLEE
jgi:FKBP-type peptidyl-prolyl cis-trans isomerase